MSQDWDSYRFKQGKCLHCGITLNGLTGPRGGPTKGALMVCAKCSYVMEWDGDGFVELSAETMKEASEDPDVAQLLAVTRALRALPRIPDRVIMLEPREPQPCEVCGTIKECRPYGKKVDGKRQWVCFDCGLKDPAEMERAFKERLDGKNPL